MSRLGKVLAIVCVVGAVPALALAAAGSSTLPGTWHKLPAAPFPAPRTSGESVDGETVDRVRQRGHRQQQVGRPCRVVRPARNAWTRLSPPASSTYSPGYEAVWTGKEMLAFGAFHSMAYNPERKTWRTLRYAVPGGITVWTGREAIGWGGGCCGDAFASGAAYNPTTDSYRKLSRSPLAPSQEPVGRGTAASCCSSSAVTTPRASSGPHGSPAAPRTTRRRTSGAGSPRCRLAVCASRPAPSGTARGSRPGSRRRSASHVRLQSGHQQVAAPRSPPLPAASGATAVWTGTRLVLWGGSGASRWVTLGDGVAYNPHTNRWTSVPAAPLHARSNPAGRVDGT
jgi:hypothetical protein